MYIGSLDKMPFYFDQLTDDQIILPLIEGRRCDADHDAWFLDLLENKMCIYFHHPKFGEGHLFMS